MYYLLNKIMKLFIYTIVFLSSPFVIFVAIIYSTIKVLSNQVWSLRKHSKLPHEELLVNYFKNKPDKLRIVIIGVEGTHYTELDQGEGVDLFPIFEGLNGSEDEREPILTLRRSSSAADTLELILSHTSIGKLTKESV